MTALKSRKTRLIIESSDELREAGRYRPVVIEAHPMHATVKLKGMRQSYDIPWAAIWSMAVKAEADRKRREKASTKKGAR